MRILTYSEAINEALHQIMEYRPDVYLIGGGITSPWYVGDTTKGLKEKFPNRVIDTPTSENCITGVALGSSLIGKHPIINFPRMDFMYYAFDQMANHIANWSHMFGDQFKTPITLWCCINRGEEQSCQHSQAIYSMLCHLPNFKVVAPSNPCDAKGLLIECVEQESPTIFIDDRWLYQMKEDVPKEKYTCCLDCSALIPNYGYEDYEPDITVVTSSYLVNECIKAFDKFKNKKIHIDVIDLVSLKPLDIDGIMESVNTTKKLLVVDGSWSFCGLSAEIVAQVAERDNSIKMKRLTLPDYPAPASSILENEYYPKTLNIVKAIKELTKCKFK